MKVLSLLALSAVILASPPARAGFSFKKLFCPTIFSGKAEVLTPAPLEKAQLDLALAFRDAVYRIEPISQRGLEHVGRLFEVYQRPQHAKRLAEVKEEYVRMKAMLERGETGYRPGIVFTENGPVDIANGDTIPKESDPWLWSEHLMKDLAIHFPQGKQITDLDVTLFVVNVLKFDKTDRYPQLNDYAGVIDAIKNYLQLSPK